MFDQCWACGVQGWVIMYAVAQFVFGFGIGGEYPMTSTRATEESEEDRQYAQKHRGRKVMLAYTMQVCLAQLLLCPLAWLLYELLTAFRAAVVWLQVQQVSIAAYFVLDQSCSVRLTPSVWISFCICSTALDC